MAPRNTSQITSNEADVQLAISSIKPRQVKSNRKSAAVYNVSDRTLRRRRDCLPKTKKLTEPEEEVIVGHMLDLDQRLVPLQPDAVLSKLDVQLRTPTLPPQETTLWQARTHNNVRELEAQSTLIRDRIRRHKSYSPTSITEAINQLKKVADTMMLYAELMRDRVRNLEKAIEAASKRRQRKSKRLQQGGTLTQGQAEDLLAQRNAEQQVEPERCQVSAQSGVNRQALARCTKCREPGHNSRTCKKEALSAS